VAGRPWRRAQERGPAAVSAMADGGDLGARTCDATAPFIARRGRCGSKPSSRKIPSVIAVVRWSYLGRRACTREDRGRTGGNSAAWPTDKGECGTWLERTSRRRGAWTDGPDPASAYVGWRSGTALGRARRSSRRDVTAWRQN
jgi:hypothetical protein